MGGGVRYGEASGWLQVTVLLHMLGSFTSLEKSRDVSSLRTSSLYTESQHTWLFLVCGFLLLISLIALVAICNYLCADLVNNHLLYQIASPLKTRVPPFHQYPAQCLCLIMLRSFQSFCNFITSSGPRKLGDAGQVAHQASLVSHHYSERAGRDA